MMRAKRLGYLADSCVNLTGSAAALNTPAASTQRIAVAHGNLRGLSGQVTASSALLQAIGVSGQGGVVSAISGAAKGAAIGTVVIPIPLLGTAVGAVIGALAGGLIHTSKFPAWLAEDTNIINVLKQLPQGIPGRVFPRQTPTAQIPITLEMMWTAIVVTGNMYSYVNPNPGHSPSDMQHEFDWVMAWMASITQCMNSNPVGDNLQVTCQVGNGVTFTLSFQNPGLDNTNTVAQKVMIPAYLAWCTHNGTVDTQSNHCPGDAANPINQLVLTLMTDYVIAQVNPNAGVLVAPAPVAAPTAPVAAPVTAPVAAPPQSTIMPVPANPPAAVTVTSPATPTAPAATTTTAGGTVVTSTAPSALYSGGAPTSTPAPVINISSPDYTPVTAAPVAAPGDSTAEMLIFGAVALLAIVLLKK